MVLSLELGEQAMSSGGGSWSTRGEWCGLLPEEWAGILEGSVHDGVVWDDKSWLRYVQFIFIFFYFSVLTKSIFVTYTLL